jgi:hypothetical protein
MSENAAQPNEPRAHPAVSTAIAWLKANTGTRRFDKAVIYLAEEAAERKDPLAVRCIETLEKLGTRADLSDTDILGLVVGIQSRM